MRLGVVKVAGQHGKPQPGSHCHGLVARLLGAWWAVTEGIRQVTSGWTGACCRWRCWPGQPFWQPGSRKDPISLAAAKAGLACTQAGPTARTRRDVRF